MNFTLQKQASWTAGYQEKPPLPQAIHSSNHNSIMSKEDLGRNMDMPFQSFVG